MFLCQLSYSDHGDFIFSQVTETSLDMLAYTFNIVQLDYRPVQICQDIHFILFSLVTETSQIPQPRNQYVAQITGTSLGVIISSHEVNDTLFGTV